MNSVKFSVSEPFQAYYDQIADIPINYQHGSTLQSGRNLIKKLKISKTGGETVEIVVKSFAIPSRFKGFINSNFLQTKAKKSFLNAEYLLNLGITTPEPIACIERVTFKCIKESFYVCRFWYHNYNLGDFLYSGVSSGVDTQLLLECLAKFTAEQHNKGILHLDYNPGNILARFKDGCFSFALVDLNRVRITNIGKRDRIRGLVRLTPVSETIRIIGKEYSNQVGYNPDEFCSRLEAEHRRFWTRRIRFEKWIGALKTKGAYTKSG